MWYTARGFGKSSFAPEAWVNWINYKVYYSIGYVTDRNGGLGGLYGIPLLWANHYHFLRHSRGE